MPRGKSAVAAARPRRAGEHRASADVRERILEATFAVAREHGYSGTTIAKVSTASDLPVGSVYWHFENKDQLLAAAIEFGHHRWLVSDPSPEPMDGEDFETYVRRIFGEDHEVNPYFEDFWRIGATLLLEKSLKEHAAYDRFRQIRAEVRAQWTAWFGQVLPRTVPNRDHLADRLAGFVMAASDGVRMARAGEEDTADLPRMLGLSLLALVKTG